MDANIRHFQHQNHQSNSGLLRFRSAPTAVISNFAESVDSGANNKSNTCNSSESERLISRFMKNGANTTYLFSSPSFQEFESKPLVTAPAATVNGVNSQQVYSRLPPHYPRQSSTTSCSSAMDNSYGLMGSNLTRQSSSPAGLFSHISAQNGFGTMRGMASYTGLNTNNGDQVSPSSSRLKSQMSIPSKLPTSLGILSQISEVGPESMYGSWNDSSQFVENFTGVKRDRDNEGTVFLGTQNGEIGNRVHLLSRHLSLPKSTSSEVVGIEKFLQFQDAAPCRIRAKRGCATHPRSIAERVRRTRISERMRKLHELVPNMDKQTNTADMLDLAVEYIKALQKQFKTLSDRRANCKCFSMQKPVTNQIA